MMCCDLHTYPTLIALDLTKAEDYLLTEIVVDFFVQCGFIFLLGELGLYILEVVCQKIHFFI